MPSPSAENSRRRIEGNFELNPVRRRPPRLAKHGVRGGPSGQMRKFFGERRNHLARRRGGECRPQEGSQKNQEAPLVQSRPQNGRTARGNCQRGSRWRGGGSCRLLWIGRKVISAMHFDEQRPRDNACCNPGTVVSGGRFGPAKGQFITIFTIHGWRTDFPSLATCPASQCGLRCQLHMWKNPRYSALLVALRYARLCSSKPN